MKDSKPKRTIKVLLGWLLLAVGIFIIGWGLFSSYQIFTGKTSAPEIFKVQTETEIVKPEKVLPSEEQIKGLLQEQLKEMLPTDFTPMLFNLISWSIFVGLLIFGGSKIGLLGIRLIR